MKLAKLALDGVLLPSGRAQLTRNLIAVFYHALNLWDTLDTSSYTSTLISRSLQY